MIRYALLVAPSANRVYAGQALRLTAAELSAFAERALAGRVYDIAEVVLAGVPYLGFAADQPLGEADLAYLSRVSTAYALFEVEGDRLRPVALPPSSPVRSFAARERGACRDVRLSLVDLVLAQVSDPQPTAR